MNAPERLPLLSRYRGIHAGQSIVVCGCGESLLALPEPQRHLTIGVNDVGRLFDPTYLVVVNPRSQFKGQRFDHVGASKARALFTQLDLGPVRPPVVRFRLGQYAGTDFDAGDVLHYTQNSPYVAVCLAAYMGAARIGLVGVDFSERHFFADTGRHALADRVREIDAQYGRLRQALARRGVELLNLSASSRLLSLPRCDVAAFCGAGEAVPAPEAAVPARRVFVVNHRYIACGTVFQDGLRRAAAQLGCAHADADWDDARLPEKIADFRPDVLLVVHGRHFAQRWGERFRAYNTAVWLTEEPYEVDETRQWSRLFRTVFVNDASSRERHGNAHALPVCYDPAVHHDAGLQRSHRVGFVGAASPTRERYLAPLAEQGLLSYVVGGPWTSAALRRLCLAPHISAAETAALYQRTAIVVNVFRDRHHYNAAHLAAEAPNPRVFEALACGALVVSEPRPALAAMFPDLPAFSSPEALLQRVAQLLADPVELSRLVELNRARLQGQAYADRLQQLMELAMQTSTLPSMPAARNMLLPVDEAPWAPPDMPGWTPVGDRYVRARDETIVMDAPPGQEVGLASAACWRNACLRATVRLAGDCRLVAKVRHALRGERDANSYHLLSVGQGGQRSYVARHHQVLMPARVPRGRWFRLELYCEGTQLRLCVDGQEVGRCEDDTLAEGHAFIGTSGGRLELKELAFDELPAPDLAALLAGWKAQGTGVRAASAATLVLDARRGEEAGLVSQAALNDVELEFELRLDRQAGFIAKLHQQDEANAVANSYHLVATPAQGYLARHEHVLGRVQLARERWQRLLLRWVDQRLTVHVDGRAVLNVGDNLLQSGHCALAVTAGRAEIRALAVRDVQETSAPRGALPRAAGTAAGLPPQGIPYAHTPRRHLLYHVWPVRDSIWRWNVERLLADIDLFNGRRIIGIVHDAKSEPPELVKAAFAGHGCEFIELPNDPTGECLTFPAMLKTVASLDPDDVTFYGHAKGVRHGKAVSASIRRWTEALYDISLCQWPLVAEQLRSHALTGSFRMLGRFRAHQHLGDWHYSGTFFWLRHALVFQRPVDTVPAFYGGVEVWPGLHFRREETGCLLFDKLRELPYNEAFWRATGTPVLARWKAARTGVAPPASLQTPAPFEGHTFPRLEQIPEEFAWFLEQLVAAAPRSILTIGSMHGGVEWHIARRFRERHLDVQITAVDLGGRPELLQAMADAGARWSQRMETVIGDSTAAATRAQLAPHYDAVFIDGDHGYRGARLDFEFALTRTPRLIALHDIVDSMWHAEARCCVSRLWSEIEALGNGEALRLGEWGGIGIHWPKPDAR